MGMIFIVLASTFATAFNASASTDRKSWFTQVFENAFSLTAFVTFEDKSVFVGTVCYVLYYCIRVQVCNLPYGCNPSVPCISLSLRLILLFKQSSTWYKGGSASKPINPVLASITVAVHRIFGSADNPYTPIISFLMLTWTLHKISVFERMGGKSGIGGGWLRAVDIILDCLLLSAMLYAGVVVQVKMLG